MRKLFLIILFLSILSCEKNTIQIDKKLEPFVWQTDSNPQLSNYTNDQLIRIYNSNINYFAQAVAISLKSKELRKQIKTNALLMVDGDYDILWKDFKYKEVDNEPILRKLVNSSPLKEPFDYKLRKIDDFTKLFKQLQLSIPVNIESWDEENYTPLVGFREVNEEGYKE